MSNKEEGEEAIMKENAARFKLAYSWPMLGLELSKDLGRVGEGKLSQEIFHSQE